MNLYCIKCSIFTKNSNNTIRQDIDGKIHIYSRCIGCGFKTFESSDKEELIYLFKL